MKSSVYQTDYIQGIDFHFFPVIVRGNAATIYPHHNVLKYGRTYNVRIEPSVLATASGGLNGFKSNSAWTFTTKAAPPAAGTPRVVVAADGMIYEGRPINVRGAHTGGFNTGSVGVCLTGNFEQHTPAPIQLERVLELGGLLRDGYSITHLAGHRDFQPDDTVCPGRYLEPQLPGMAAQLGLNFGTQGYRP